MRACVFLGPTMSSEEATGLLEARYLPPVQQGDIYRVVVHHRPRALGIIDGAFHHVPAVWHKEILWAMAQGVHVFGSASMGALRAVELTAFGMHGVGRIFRAYRDGVWPPYDRERFEDDDEVAVVHGPAELRYVALSEAMVNIRATLAAAADAGIISAPLRDRLARIAKKLFYPDRSWEAVLRHASDCDVPLTAVTAVRQWLPGGRIDQKREDAREMLIAMEGFLAGPLPRATVDYVFQATDAWRHVLETGPDLGGDGRRLAAMLDELRLTPPAWSEARRAGVGRLMALAECDRRGLAVSPERRRQTATQLLRRLGIGRREELQCWLADNDLDPDGFERLVEEEARLSELECGSGGLADIHALADLRLTGRYASLAARARAKQDAVPDDAPPSLDEETRFRLRTWYLERRLARPIPEDWDAFARDLGFADAEALDHAVWHEYRYLARAPVPSSAAPVPPAGPSH